MAGATGAERRRLRLSGAARPHTRALVALLAALAVIAGVATTALSSRGTGAAFGGNEGLQALVPPVLVRSSPHDSRGQRFAVQRGAKGEPQIVEPSAPDEETEVWREAYALEVDRSELIAAQLQTELDRLGDVSAELREEFEGCVVDLEPVPSRPESEAANEWAEAYTAIRRCNEQSELRLTEMRAKIQERGMAEAEAKKPEVTLDFGPIRHMGITFKGITFKRFGSESGSQIFFVELPMPLGVKLSESTVELRSGGVGRAVEVSEVLDSGSVGKDGRVRNGDYLRAITVPQRRLSQNKELGDEEVGNFADAIGVGAGTLEKALLVIPLESSFPFEQVLDDITKNKQVDGLVGMVFERPFN